jgi:predicted NAD/FAD-binding protein
MQPIPRKHGLRIAIVGSGISGLSAAWLLAPHHQVTVFERADRLGGHSNTVLAETPDGPIPVDTGFIVYNEVNYPNLTALFAHLKVPTQASEMSFAVSFDNGAFEYSGNGLSGLFAQKRNLFRPCFWSMLRDLRRFYRDAPSHIALLEDPRITLKHYLNDRTYGEAFINKHLLPMAGAIWSAPPNALLDHPAGAFIQFHRNHGLLQIHGRPVWRTVSGGSRNYINRLTRSLAECIRLDAPVTSVCRSAGQVTLREASGRMETFDHVILACHANQALATLADPTPEEQTLLGAFQYNSNVATLHSDATLMPIRRAAWSSWNYIGHEFEGEQRICVTYWMNRLQGIPEHLPLFVTLNPSRPPRPGSLHHSEVYEHPVLDTQAVLAQRRLWSLQGRQQTWYCGSYFGAGFHEDGLQSGLAVAETLGGVRRPWSIANESARICVGPEEHLPRLPKVAA